MIKEAAIGGKPRSYAGGRRRTRAAVFELPPVGRWLFFYFYRCSIAALGLNKGL
jgi:hypothetical protein